MRATEDQPIWRLDSEAIAINQANIACSNMNQRIRWAEIDNSDVARMKIRNPLSQTPKDSKSSAQ